MSSARVAFAAALVLAFVAGCDGEWPSQPPGPPPPPPSGHDRPYEDLCGETPDECLGHCVTSMASVSFEDCCDSVTCNCDPETHEWSAWLCDPPAPPPDAGPDASVDAAPDAAPDAG